LIHKLKQERKTIVAHFNGLAASGALYATAGADEIYAEENTLTGSIGVIAHVVVASELMKEKLGLDVITITSEDAKRKAVGNWLKLSGQWTEADQKEMLRLLNHYHKLFVKRLLEGRNGKGKIDKKWDPTGKWTQQYAEKLADGSIYTLDQAMANGLVDHKDDLEAAIRGAAALANLRPNDYRVVRYFDLANLLILQRAMRGERSIDVNVNLGPLQSRDIGRLRGRFLYLSPYRR
jgi:protease-4